MDIPKKFQIGGQTYTVRINEKQCNDLNAAGAYKTGSNQIVLRKLIDSTTLYPKSQIEQTFLHELVHVILYAMNEMKLFEDEKFVDLFATFLHQALTTQKGSIE